MKRLVLGLFLLISTVCESQVIKVKVKQFEYLGSIGNVDYMKVVLNPTIRLSTSTDENFIIDLTNLKISHRTGVYTYQTDIISVDTINKKVFVIKYNEDPNESSSKLPVVMELNLNRNEKSLKYKTFNDKDNYTIVKSTVESKFKIN